MGMIALVGGNEFGPNCRLMDLWMLERIVQRLAEQKVNRPPQVVIIPTAAAQEEPRVAANNGIHHFKGLHTQVSAAMILDRIDANSAAEVDKLRDADLIYLTGGNPWYLHGVLANTDTLNTLREAVRRGAIVAGSSAGAMVLADYMRERLSAGWLQAFGLVKGVAVLPHYDRTGKINYAPLRKALDPKVVILGIEEGTACVCREDGQWQVIGMGQVSIVGATTVDVYNTGETFSLSEQQW